jgi:hypothetical protein
MKKIRADIYAGTTNVQKLNIESDRSDRVLTFFCNQLTRNLKQKKNEFHVIGDSRYFNDLTCEQVQNAKSNVNKILTLDSCLKSLPEEFGSKVIVFNNLGKTGFSSQPDLGIFHGSSVMYIAIQCAFFYGATDIYIHGAKFDYGMGINRARSMNNVSLPDITLSDIIKCIREYAEPELQKSNVKLFFQQWSVLL